MTSEKIWNWLYYVSENRPPLLLHNYASGAKKEESKNLESVCDGVKSAENIYLEIRGMSTSSVLQVAPLSPYTEGIQFWKKKHACINPKCMAVQYWNIDPEAKY